MKGMRTIVLPTAGTVGCICVVIIVLRRSWGNNHPHMYNTYIPKYPSTTLNLYDIEHSSTCTALVSKYRSNG